MVELFAHSGIQTPTVSIVLNIKVHCKAQYLSEYGVLGNGKEIFLCFRRPDGGAFQNHADVWGSAF